MRALSVQLRRSAARSLELFLRPEKGESRDFLPSLLTDNVMVRPENSLKSVTDLDEA